MPRLYRLNTLEVASMTAQVGISIEWVEYADYPVYTQRFLPFVENVSVLDLIMNTGPQAKRYMKSFSSYSGDGMTHESTKSERVKTPYHASRIDVDEAP